MRERSSRREFLRRAAIVGGGTLLTVCSPEATPTLLPTSIPSPTHTPTPTHEPTPTPRALPRPTATPIPEATLTSVPTPTLEPTRAPTPTRTPTPEPTPKPTQISTPEAPKLLERIGVDIPGLTVERYAVRIQEITDVPKSYKLGLDRWVAEPYSVLHLQSMHYNQCGPFIVDIDSIKPRRPQEHFLYDGRSGRFYKTGMVADNSTGRVGEEDKKLLNWQDVDWQRDWVSVETTMTDVSCDGKLLYSISRERPSGPSSVTSEKTAVIILDIFNGTKTVIKDDRSNFFRARLTNDGNNLLLSFPKDTNAKRGTYLIGLDSWQVKFHLNESSSVVFLNEDGSLLYLLMGDYTERIGYTYNTVTGEKRLISWPQFLTPYRHIASPNLRFIARRLGMLPSAFIQEGQFGIVVQTPAGQFAISHPSLSFIPKRVDNEGNIHTTRGDIFKFEDGTYKLAKVGSEIQDAFERRGGPMRLEIRKVGG